MNYEKNILLAILGAASLTSCDLLGDIFAKEIDCPGFPEYLMDYFPYNGIDTLRLVNQHSDNI